MVHFVSAGPGAEDLITIRGKELLSAADVVIYAGSLVNPALLSYTKEGCRIYNSAHMDLEDVMEVIRDAEEKRKMAVRLHTGDTSVYSTIREQMDELDEEGIAYDVTPGVSAFQAAAASLQAELTLPDISQTVILTRGNGRTKVPERESLRSLAGHHATMVLYLSSSLAYEVQKELSEGGYAPNTPVDVVYKASWPEEKMIRSTLEEFPEKMEEEHITKTALILVGDVLGTSKIQGSYDQKVPRSRLYDPEFSTGIRKGKVLHIWMVACTGNGVQNMQKLRRIWEEKLKQEEKNAEFELHIKCSAVEGHERKSLRLLTREAFDQSDVIIFFSSTGIAVRSIAPYLKSKMTDPAVLVIDEKARNCIPLVSGHIGGANEYAKEVERMIGSHAIITTATDLEHKFSVDVFAKSHDLTISNMEKAKEISAKVVNKETVFIFSDLPITEKLPDELKKTENIEQADLILTGNRDRIQSVLKRNKTEGAGRGIGLILIPKLFDLGIGCRRNTSFDEMKKAIEDVLIRLNTVPKALHGIGSITLKADEPAFKKVKDYYHLEPEFFSAEQLQKIPGEFTKSQFVKKITGVDNVCERSAVKLSGGTLILRKAVYGNVTVAVAKREIIL